MQRSLIDLALRFQSQGRYLEALALFRQALAICEETLSRHHPDVAMLLEKMAQLYRDMGVGDEAELLEARARSVRAEDRGY